MNIGILGSGDVAKALAGGFLRHGYEVMLGTRDTSKLAQWAEQQQKVRTGSFAEAASFGDIVVLAVKGSAAMDVLRLADLSVLAGKTVIDVTNPIADTAPVNGVLSYYTRLDGTPAAGVRQCAFREGV